MVIVRWAASMAMAVSITFGLFFFMQALIATGEGLDEPLNVVKIVDSTMPEIELEVIEEIDKPELIEEITEVVEEVERQVTISDGPDLNIDRSQVQMTPVLSSVMRLSRQPMVTTYRSLLLLHNTQPGPLSAESKAGVS